MPVASCSIPAGSSSTEGWAVVLDGSDLAALPAVDFKTAGSGEIDGAVFTLDRPTMCSRMELDGSTGLVMECDPSHHGWLYDWTPSNYWTGALLRVELDQLIAGWNGQQQFAVQMHWTNITAPAGKYYSGAGIWLAEKPVPDAAGQLFGTRTLSFGASPSRAEVTKGGNGYNPGTTFEAMQEVIYPAGGAAPMARQGPWPGTWEEPGKWPATYEGICTPKANVQNPNAIQPLLTGASTNLVGLYPSQQHGGDGPVSATLAGLRILIP
ncbi:MAG: hypothetical protein K0U52_02245 [Gammaproteobacteria bacterium]|nr:hypothetical protein [Gammaproteobacteria bacterium]